MAAPKIRFKGFKDDWEEKKLANYMTINTIRNNDNVFSKNDVLSVSGEYGIVNQIELQGRSFAGESIANYHVVNVGDVVYTKSPLKNNPYGIIKTNHHVAGVVSTLYAVYQVLPSADSTFIEKYFENDLRLNSYLKPIVNIGAKHDMKIHNQTVLSNYVIFPTLSEQQKIGDFLSQVDTSISLQERKVTSLKRLKKGLMQKIFSRKLRFRADDGSEFPDWEEKKLSNYCEKIGSGKTPAGGAQVYESSGIMLIRSQNVENARLNIAEVAYINDIINSTMKNSIVNYGDVLLNITGASIGRCCLFDLKVPANVNQHVCIIRVNEYADSLFVMYQILCSEVQQQIEKIQSGGSKQGLNFQQILNFNVVMPCVQEQQKIADFLSSMDKKIEAAGQRLTKLKTIKKGLLQKMFV